MAYGKIKADTLVYDNSGSDVEKTVASLAASAPTNNPTFTGTINGAALTLSGDLTVNGTTTTINSTTLAVDDKNIVLGSVDTPTDTTADGGGITLKGAADKTFNWVDATDAWTSSEHIITATGKRINIGTTTEGNPNADNLTIEDSAACGITIRSASNNAGSIYFSDATSGSGEYMGTIVFNHTNNTFNFDINGTTALTLDSSQNATFAGTVSDSKGNVRQVPANTQSGSSNYDLVAADSGKAIARSGGNVTVPNSIFTTGDLVTIINNSAADITLTQGSGVTMYNSADAATGNRTLAARGMATIYFTGASSAYISGAGLS